MTRPSLPASLKWLLIPLLALSLAFASGCGDDGESGGGSSELPAKLDPVSVESLTGKSFGSIQVIGSGPAHDNLIYLSFGPGILTASAGCNSIRGPYEIEDGSLTLGKAAATLLGCPEDRQAFDEWLTDWLSSGVDVSGRGDKLLLTDGETSIKFEERPLPGTAPPVIGTTWELNSYDDADGNAVSMKPGVRLPFIQFQENDRVKLFDGCNSGSGKAQVNEDGSMVFGPLALTRKACQGLTADVSGAILNVLKGKTAYAFEAQNLIISRQGSSLTFTPG